VEDPPLGEGLIMLLGRQSERKVLDDLLASAREGRSGALVIHGEAGVGKTALLQYAIEAASDLRVLRAVGMESEMELAFAGVRQICGPLIERIDSLPSPQAEALAITFGLRAGTVPDRLFVALAVLTLLSEGAEGRPLLCVVDDAEWLDQASAQVLGFAARRLVAESVVMLLAARKPAHELGGLPALAIEGLSENEAQRLLRTVMPGRIDERVRDQLVADAQGNPLALLELPRGLSLRRLAGGFGLPAALSLSKRIEESFLMRLETLPRDVQRLLLAAAADPLGDPALLSRAGARLGVEYAALDSAEIAGLLELGTRVRFRHPLVRSAVYHAASTRERQEVHRALAEATDPAVDPDRRAWHLAEATAGPDEAVAAELERAADRAQARGGVAAAAAFLERAAALSVEPSHRARRTLAAAQAMHLAGTPSAALALLGAAEQQKQDALWEANANLLRAQIAFAQREDRDAPLLLLKAAQQLEPLDLGLALETHLDVLSATVFFGGLDGRERALEMARAALAAPRPEHQRPSDLLLDALATRFTGGYAPAAPMLREAMRAFPSDDGDTEKTLRWMWLAGQAAADLWDDETWALLANRYLELARQAGALAVLPFALNLKSGWHTFAGELAAAATLADEAQVVGEATGNQFPPYAGVMLAAWRGREAEAVMLIEPTRREAQARGETYALAFADWATALLYNSLCRPDEALTAAERASEHLEDPVISNWGLVELNSAAFESGRTDLATEALDRLSRITRVSATDWALGIEARCRALTSEDEVAESLYREAIERIGRTRVGTELARAHLFYGEWLCKQGRQSEAREQLRTARDMFVKMGAEAFAARSERELAGTGERVRQQRVEAREELTAQEMQIAQLARDGLSNSEIGGRLFISPRTVEYHLHKVFTKLGISSRRGLREVLPTEMSPALAK
jgi:DNA-binding CsgD family transcriptional regulator